MCSVQIGLLLKTGHGPVKTILLCCDGNGTVCVTVVNAALADCGRPELNVKQQF